MVSLGNSQQKRKWHIRTWEHKGTGPYLEYWPEGGGVSSGVAFLGNEISRAQALSGLDPNTPLDAKILDLAAAALRGNYVEYTEEL